MKNLFTKMMLVAVAAMGITACQNEPLTVTPGNETSEKTTIEVVADLETTRSAFGEKDGNNVYSSYWQGGEQVKAAIIKLNESYSYSGQDYYEVTKSDVATVAASGSVANISLTFPYMPATYGTMLIASPAGSVDIEDTAYYYDGDEPGFKVNIPTEQTPLAASVDPAAHILTATYTGTLQGEAVKPEWEHAAAYAKMTLKNFDAAIDNVVVTIDSKSYILNPAEVVNNVFWFACEANEAPSTVKVAVNTADEKAYVKTLDLTKGNGLGLPFVKGKVAEFSVNMKDATPEEGGADGGTPLNFPAGTYMWDTISYNDGGYFEITSSTNAHGSGSLVRIFLNEADRPENKSIKLGTYTAAPGNKKPEVGCFCVKIVASGSAAFWTMTEASLPTDATLEVNYYDGKYQILFTKNAREHHGYEGFTEGWDAPAGGDEPEPTDPVQLNMPEGLTAEATSDTATIKWNAVDNASSYEVTVGGSTQIVTTTTATFDGLAAETTYNVSVVAVGDGTNYTNSEAATTTVTTDAAQTGGGELGSETNPYTFTSVKWVYSDMVFSGAEDNAELTLMLWSQLFTGKRIFSDKDSFYSVTYKVNGSVCEINMDESYSDIEEVGDFVGKVKLFKIKTADGREIYYKYDEEISLKS